MGKNKRNKFHYITTLEKVTKILKPRIEKEIGYDRLMSMITQDVKGYTFHLCIHDMYTKRLYYDLLIVSNDFEVLNGFGDVDIEGTNALRFALASDKECGEKYLADLYAFLIAKSGEEIKRLKELVNEQSNEN